MAIDLVPSSPADAAAQTGEDPNNPAIPMAAYDRMKPRWEICRRLMAGNEAVRDSGEDSLPRFEGESDISYDARVQIAALSNGFARTVYASVGMLLQADPVLGADMPQAIKDLAEDVDGAGTHLAVFTQELALHGVIDGIAGIFSDFSRPDAVAPATAAGSASAAAVPGAALSADDEKRLGLRPFWTLYTADNIVKTVYETIDGVRTLTLLVLRQVRDERVGQFGVQSRTRLRVYTNDRRTIAFQQWVVPIGGGVPTIELAPRLMRNVTAIPWAPNRAGQIISETETSPPLLNLAYLNLEHHRTKTNMLNLQELACVPTLVRIGAQADAAGAYPPIQLGPRNTIEAPRLEGVPIPVYWLSPTVDVLDFALRTLEATEAAMAREGGAFLAPDPAGVESAEAKRIKGAAQRATLASVSRALQDCLEAAAGFSAQFLLAKGGSISLNRDFEQLELDSATMTAYVDAVDRAGLPIRVLLEAWQKGGRIREETDLEDLELEMMANVMARRAEKAAAAEALAAKADPANQDISAGLPS